MATTTTLPGKSPELKILVVSCYELGHQPVAVASAIGFLERAGYSPQAVDLAVDSLPTTIDPPRLVLLSTPMHTALRIAVGAAEEITRRFPAAHVCFFGHYATLNADYLLSGPADSIVGGEAEEALVQLADALSCGKPPHEAASVRIERLNFASPRREGLPGLRHYASLEIDGTRRPAGAVETSRGCLHHCRHCPIPPVYEGRFFVVPRDIVLGDIEALVELGAEHVTFSDPDFFNGPGHAVAIVERMHERFPSLTFDATIKVEHLLKHRRYLPRLAENGCLFVVSAVESLSEEVLDHLAKGHTREDVFTAQSLLRDAGIALRPSLLAFTPWTRLDDYLELLDWVAAENLVDHLEPVQFSIRLLIPPGSPLVDHPAMHPHLGPLIRDRFSYEWRHPDPRMDELQRDVATIVQHAANTDASTDATFEQIRARAYAVAGRAEEIPLRRIPVGPHVPPPRLTEPWFC